MKTLSSGAFFRPAAVLPTFIELATNAISPGGMDREIGRRPDDRVHQRDRRGDLRRIGLRDVDDRQRVLAGGSRDRLAVFVRRRASRRCRQSSLSCADPTASAAIKAVAAATRPARVNPGMSPPRVFGAASAPRAMLRRDVPRRKRRARPENLTGT